MRFSRDEGEFSVAGEEIIFSLGLSDIKHLTREGKSNSCINHRVSHRYVIFFHFYAVSCHLQNR